MFNGYEMIAMIKLRQMEIEKKAKNAWRFYENPMEEQNLNKRNASIDTKLNDNCCTCCA